VTFGDTQEFQKGVRDETGYFVRGHSYEERERKKRARRARKGRREIERERELTEVEDKSEKQRENVITSQFLSFSIYDKSHNRQTDRQTATYSSKFKTHCPNLNSSYCIVKYTPALQKQNGKFFLSNPLKRASRLKLLFP
jgi:hypothetical protein